MADDSKLDRILNRMDVVNDKVSDLSSKLEVHISKFDAHIEHEEEQRAELKRNNEILQQNTISLQDHMRRTDQLEDYVKKMDERFTPMELEAIRKKAVDEAQKARQTANRAKLAIIGKIVGSSAGIGLIAAAIKFLAHLL